MGVRYCKGVMIPVFLWESTPCPVAAPGWMFMIRRFACLLFLLLSPCLHAAGNGHTRLIAFAQDTMANDFRKAQVFEVRDALKKLQGISFVYSDARGKTSLLIHQIESFIRQPVDLLIIGTNDANAVVPVISKAYHQGIPVIILDRGIEGEAYTTFINSDNIKIGRLGAEYIAEQLDGKGRVLLFEGIQEADVTQLRSKGFLDAIAAFPGIEVIKRTGNYLRKDALIEMEKLVAAGIHVDAIFSESDSMLSGVRMVLHRHAIEPGSIVMVGCDYTSEAREAIRNGSQSASVRFPLGGKEAAAVALDILLGKSVPKRIVIPVELVSRDNVDSVAPIF
jgi:ribose transport system substrate-binding protein